MKKFILISILFSFISCTSMMMLTGTKYNYQYELVEPELSDNMSFQDENIDIFFSIGEKSVNFKLKNKGDSPLKIIWDNTSIVQYGEAKKIMHAGVKYTDRNLSQPPTVIPPNASIEDLILPSENVYWRSGSQYTSGGWEEHDLFSTSDFNKPEIKEGILAHKGTKFSIYMPIEKDGEELNYNFEFKITDVKPVNSESETNSSNQSTANQETKNR